MASGTQFEGAITKNKKEKKVRGKSLISISIDLNGSTLTKQSVVENSTDDHGYRAELYEQYLKLLFNGGQPKEVLTMTYAGLLANDAYFHDLASKDPELLHPALGSMLRHAP